MLIDDTGEVVIGKVLPTADPSKGVEEVLIQTLERSGRSAVRYAIWFMERHW